MLQEDYLELVSRVDTLVAALSEHADEAVREQSVELLQLIDLLHREALLRLTDGLRSHGAGDALDRVTGDPVVRLLLGLYGLAELGLPEEPEPPTMRDGFFPADRLAVHRRSTPAAPPTPVLGEP